MDERLFNAARTGNVDEMHRLLSEDPFILLRVASVTAETPLHLASMAGHLDFVKETVKLMPEFAGKSNQDGLSPIHLASANGYVEIVKELLMTINCDQQCRLESNRDKKTPIHYAVIKGRTDVITELISSCKECLDDVTIRGETALHLAVKNNQVEAFRVMVERLKDLNKEDILNVKDKEGNTVLHLATSMKQSEVLKLLLPVNDMGTTSSGTSGAVEVNAVNGCNLTALDLLLLLPNESNDIHIEEILRLGGAKRAKELVENVQVLISSSSSSTNNININQATNSVISNTTTNNTYKTRFDRWSEFFKFQGDSPHEARNALLVLAVLITTATYQAILSPPGGVDDKSGKSVLGSTDPGSFKRFLYFNSAGFFISLHMIAFLSEGLPMRLEVFLCIIALVLTYDSTIYSLIDRKNDSEGLADSFLVISIVYTLALYFGPALWKLFWRCWSAIRKWQQRLKRIFGTNSSVFIAS